MSDRRPKNRKPERDFDVQNSAKSTYNPKGRRARNKQRKNENYSNKLARHIGIGISVVQLFATLYFTLNVFLLNMLPTMYFYILFAILFILFLLPFLGQFFSKKRAIFAKVFSCIMIVALLFGGFYVGRTNGAIGAISGGDEKLDSMVVAVLADDSAETIEDAKGYSFGVQYSQDGDDVKDTVSAIESELSTTLDVVEYGDRNAQKDALISGNVQAMVFNEAFIGVLEEAHPGFEQSIKIIYTHEIKTVIQNVVQDVDVQNNSFIVYISGIDVYGKISTNSRSDVNILAVVNPDTHQVLLVNTPRDYYIEIPGITNGAKDKLTHAANYGVDYSMATLEQLYGIEIPFYARVNFTSMIDIVDALGGVDVNSEYGFTTTVGGMWVDKGMNNFTGEEALDFCRERKNVPGGDEQRGKNQQAVITAMLEKMMSPAMLMGAGDIIDSVSGNVDTNMTEAQIQTLIKDQLESGSDWDIQSIAVTGTGSSAVCYSGGSAPLSIIDPDMSTVEAATVQIENVMEGLPVSSETVESN